MGQQQLSYAPHIFYSMYYWLITPGALDLSMKSNTQAMKSQGFPQKLLYFIHRFLGSSYHFDIFKTSEVDLNVLSSVM